VTGQTGARPAEAVLLVPVPAAEPLVGELRAKYDPSAAAGVPAHITINFPFTPWLDAGPHLRDELADLFASFQAFRFKLTGLCSFPGKALYLSPEPAALFVDMIQAVALRFPQSPPYGGAYKTITPHLTLAQSEAPDVLRAAEAEAGHACRGALPLRTIAQEVWLMDDRTERWQRRAVFRLAES
jgi:2'-5' RNA ligase